MITPRARQLFADAVLPHLDDAYGLARWLTGSSADAEDIVQEACLRALGALETARRDNPRAWLLAIVRNTAFTWMAKNRPKSVIVVDDAQLESAASDAADPEAAMIAGSEASAMQAAIAALPAHLREVIVMRDLNGLSYRDIAQVLSAPVGTVMSRLSRARALLISKIGSRS